MATSSMPSIQSGEASRLLTAQTAQRFNGAAELPAQRRVGGTRSAVKWLMGSTGAGMFADGYDFFSVDLAVAIISQIHPEHVDPRTRGLVVSSAFAGAAIGYFAAGAGLPALLGRRTCSMVATLLTMVGCCLSACCQPGQALGLMLQLSFCRFLVGFGIGCRDWPPTAALCAEMFVLPSFRSQLRGDAVQFLVANSLCFFVGQLIAPITVLILLYGNQPLDGVWRLTLASGVVPSAVGLIIRLLTHDMKAFALLDDEAALVASQPGSSLMNLHQSFDGRKLLLALGACLALPINIMVVFSLGSAKSLFAEEILGTASTAFRSLERDAAFAIFMSFFAIAGAGVAFLSAGQTRCFSVQLGCFAGLGVGLSLASGILCLPSTTGSRWPMLLLLLGLSWLTLGTGLAFANAGPLHLPLASRSAASGVVTALGQLGAAAAAALLPIGMHRFGMAKVLAAYGTLSCIAALATMLFTPREEPGSANLFCDDCEEKH